MKNIWICSIRQKTVSQSINQKKKPKHSNSFSTTHLLFKVRREGKKKKEHQLEKVIDWNLPWLEVIVVEDLDREYQFLNFRFHELV